MGEKWTIGPQWHAIGLPDLCSTIRQHHDEHPTVVPLRGNPLPIEFLFKRLRWDQLRPTSIPSHEPLSNLSGLPSALSNPRGTGGSRDSCRTTRRHDESRD